MAPFLGGQATILGSRPRFDFEAVFAIPKGHTHLLIESKQDSSHFGALRQQREPVFGHAYQTIPVLAMPIMSSRVAELCEVNDWSWFDLAGNFHIEVHFALIGEEMNPSIDRRVHKPISVLPLLGGSFEHCQLRKMQESGGPAQYRKHFGNHVPSLSGPGLGLINKVICYLRDQAWIDVSTDRGFRLCDPMSLLLAWRDAYRFDRHQRMV